MAISSIYSADTYNGNGITTSFPITFAFLSNGDNVKASIKVKSTGVITLLTPITDYTIVGSNVVLVSAATAPTGTQVILELDLDYLQETDYQENGPLPAETLEADLDKLTLETQVNKETASRSIKFDSSVTGMDLTIEASSTNLNNANKVITVNSDGTGLILTTGGSGGGITAIVEDTTPQLGGDLDLNGHNINGTGNYSTTGTVQGRVIASDGAKLDGISSGADVTATALGAITGVTVASDDLVVIKDVSASNALKTVTVQSIADLASGSGITAVVDDTSPQLGGDLDLNNHVITGDGSIQMDSGDIVTGNGSLFSVGTGGGGFELKGAGSSTFFTTLETSQTADRTITLPDNDGTIALLSDITGGGITASSTDTLTNKTIDADGTGNVITNIGSSEVKSELITGQTTATAVGTDYVLISDTSASGALRKALVSDFAGGSGITAVVDDTSPQLGGGLDLNSYDISGTGNISITGSIAASSTVDTEILRSIVPSTNKMLKVYCDTTATDFTVTDLVSVQTVNRTIILPDNDGTVALLYDIPLVATQSDQETSTSTTTFVAPGRQQYHPSAAKFHVNFLDVGTLSSSYNVTSVTKNSTGNYTVNLTTAFSSSSWVPIVQTNTPGGANTARIESVAAGTLNVLCVLNAGSTAATPTRMFAAGFGDQ